MFTAREEGSELEARDDAARTDVRCARSRAARHVGARGRDARDHDLEHACIALADATGAALDALDDDSAAARASDARSSRSQRARPAVATSSDAHPLPPPSRPAIPSEYPIVSAVHMRWRRRSCRRLEADLEDDDDSFDVDVAPFHGDSTAQVAKQRSNSRG